MDEEFLKHYKVDEIQGAAAGINPLVDEQFLRHYQVEEIMAAAGSSGFNSSYGAGASAGYYAGYDYYMQGQGKIQQCACTENSKFKKKNR